jgi:hypothetical protein
MGREAMSKAKDWVYVESNDVPTLHARIVDLKRMNAALHDENHRMAMETWKTHDWLVKILTEIKKLRDQGRKP